jgi:hypothetical protein
VRKLGVLPLLPLTPPGHLGDMVSTDVAAMQVHCQVALHRLQRAHCQGLHRQGLQGPWVQR